MMAGMKQKLRIGLAALLLGVGLLLTPVTARAASSDDDERIEVREQMYPKGVKTEGGSTAITWMLLFFLALICVSVLFKNAKRTHLD
jgi:hypothetical protein